jgi:hypothetical protein
MIKFVGLLQTDQEDIFSKNVAHSWPHMYLAEMIGREHSSVFCPTYNNKIIYYINKK